MKKNGFTLAEVLVTLGVIGVVSAITLPTLLSNTTDSQIGPKLAKAVSAFEQANEALLNAESVDTLSDARLLVSNDTYANAIMQHLKASYIGGTNVLSSKDGIDYTFEITTPNPDNPQDPAYNQNIGNLVIDINGTNRAPNDDATDVFYFTWWNDGSLRPRGGTGWSAAARVRQYAVPGGNLHWTTRCAIGQVPATPSYCAGHVFENNLKVLYK